MSNLREAKLEKFGINKDTINKLGVFEDENNYYVGVNDEIHHETGFATLNKETKAITLPSFTPEPPKMELFPSKSKEIIICDNILEWLTIAQMYKFQKAVYLVLNEDMLKDFSAFNSAKNIIVVNSKQTHLCDVHKYFKEEYITRVKLPYKASINKFYVQKEFTIIQNLLEGKDVGDGLNVVSDDWLTAGLGFEASLFSFPWQSMNDLVGGIKKNEIFYIVAGSAGGKTDCAFRIAKGLVDQGEKVGIFAMEQKYPQEVLFQMASYEGEFKYDVNEIMENANDMNAECMAKYVEKIKAFKDRVSIFDTTKVSLSIENLEMYIRNFVRVAGCKHIIIDHITYFAHKAGGAGVEMVGAFASKIIELSQELGCTFIITTQVHKMGGKGQDAEDGARIGVGDIFGSSAINHSGSLIISLERNSLSDDDEEKNTTTCRILKSRFDPQSMGKTFEMWYDVETAQKIDKSERASYLAKIEARKINEDNVIPF